MGIGSTSCSTFLNDPNLNNVIMDVLQANPTCNLAFDTDVEKLPHVFSACTCSQIKTVTTFGYTVSGYTFSPNNGAVFTADYPTSSPFVTSVGATQFISNDGQTVTEEVVCSILTGAIITTGGGFSTFQPMPVYQKAVVTKYVNSYKATAMPPSFTYHPKRRAYPDIAFNGHHYKVFFSNNTSDSCPCPATAVDGTSCSAPALSGFISLINDKLMNNGKESLGFLNYLLYQMYGSRDNVFNDITSGNNNCNRGYCCMYGYQAVPGYDVTSGLGSPNFENMLHYILAAKGISTN